VNPAIPVTLWWSSPQRVMIASGSSVVPPVPYVLEDYLHPFSRCLFMHAKMSVDPPLDPQTYPKAPDLPELVFQPLSLFFEPTLYFVPKKEPQACAFPRILLLVAPELQNLPHKPSLSWQPPPLSFKKGLALGFTLPVSFPAISPLFPRKQRLLSSLFVLFSAFSPPIPPFAKVRNLRSSRAPLPPTFPFRSALSTPSFDPKISTGSPDPISLSFVPSEYPNFSVPPCAIFPLFLPMRVPNSFRRFFPLLILFFHPREEPLKFEFFSTLVSPPPSHSPFQRLVCFSSIFFFLS